MKHGKMKACTARNLCAGILGMIILVIAGCASGKLSSELADYLHVPSPDWSEQIVYFILTDRFNDGDPSNSNQGKGEYDPNDHSRYQGGDLKGITDKIDYIKGLGATAVWITPPVANQWWDPMVNYGGYHGYWAEHLMKVDKHKGTLNDYKTLSATLHRNDMYLIQDIVPNHMGNYFRITGEGDDMVFERNTRSVPVTAPTQKPFNMVDWNNRPHRDAEIYHWTGNITDHNSDFNRHNHQLSDLDDLNTENPVVIKALKESYGYWIREVGVDGFRVDTAKYIPMDFWRDFFHGEGGIMEQARATGRTNFTAFGEAWYGSTAYNDTADRLIATFLGRDENPGFPQMLNFSLHSELIEVFARGKATDRMDYRMRSLKRQFRDLRKLYNFIDNHDMERFLSYASVEDLELALLYIYTIPGVPVIYYGTEQGFTGVRHSMFAAGWGSGGKDHFNTESRLYRYLADLAKLRRSNRVFSQGEVEVFATTRQGPGILGYKTSQEGRTFITLLNTSPNAILAGNMKTGIPDAILRPVYTLREDEQAVSTDPSGVFSLLMPAKSAIVYEVQTGKWPGESLAAGTLEGPSGVWKSARTVRGSAAGLTQARIVIDGNWRTGIPVSGTFETLLPIDSLSAGKHSAELAGFDRAGRLLVSAPYEFTVELDFRRVLGVTDPVGDDLGPKGVYGYPTDPSFDDRHADMVRMDVLTAGTNLQLVFTMNAPISTVWGPQNGFDHVAFYIYFQLPGSTSTVTAMPLQNAELPEGMTWDYFSQIGGWINFYYTSKDADAGNPGTSMVPGPEIKVDKANRQIVFTWSGESFGAPATLRGTRIYAATYDYDGMSSSNRAMKPEPGEWSFSGGDGATDPLFMDWIGPVNIP